MNGQQKTNGQNIKKKNKNKMAVVRELFLFYLVTAG